MNIRIRIKASETLLDKVAMYGAGGRERVVWVGRLQCRALSIIHSTDRVRVERGGPPERMCGYHASQI